MLSKEILEKVLLLASELVSGHCVSSPNGALTLIAAPRFAALS
jgi:hypothetical protein